LKIFVNRQPVTGPWGGGNKTLSSLCEKLVSLGHVLTFDLQDDCEIIFCFDPRRSNNGYDYEHFLRHKRKFGTKIIHRVGDVGSHSKPELTRLLRATLPNADRVIFTSLWAKEYLQYHKKNGTVIENGALTQFYKHRKKTSTKDQKIKIVTHHWSDNEKKGFDVYSTLGQLVHKEILDCIEFTYIGRYSSNFSSTGINVIEPKDKLELSKILPAYDIYLTASVEEAGANHVLEAMACGLPILYRETGGSIVDYCSSFGVPYSDNVASLLNGITKIINRYDFYLDNVKQYTRTTEDVVDEYMEIINEFD
tara:strand:- start:356 stop:1279 length:924 start_codon:yes stop_codon:yes gene_type:complete